LTLLGVRDQVHLSPGREEGWLMARLIVEPRGTAAEGAAQGVASAGNSDPLYLVVSVTDTGGVPVSGLAAGDFTIDAKIVAAGGSQVEIASAGGGQNGDYSLDVVPVTFQGTQYTWKVGRYIFFLAVTRGADRGQTVCAVFVH
jgi:hypothetical protein